MDSESPRARRRSASVSFCNVTFASTPLKKTKKQQSATKRLLVAGTGTKLPLDGTAKKPDRCQHSLPGGKRCQAQDKTIPLGRRLIPYPPPYEGSMNRYYFDIDDISAYFQRCGKLSLRNGKHVRR